MKRFSTLTILLFSLLFITACGGGNNNHQDPYIMGHKPSDKARVYTVKKKKEESAITIATIQAESQKEIAKINKERDLELKKMEEKSKRLELQTKNELAVKEHNLSTFVQESKYAFKNSTLVIAALAFFALLSLTFYIFKKRREDKIKIHEENLQKEMYLREKELQVKMAEKILDTIASGNLSEEREQHLLETLDKTTPALPPKK